MKRIFIPLYIGLTFLLTSCMTQEVAKVEDEAVVDTSVKDVITASVMQTRTMTDDGVKVLWKDGDKIGLFVANSSTATERKRSAIFQTSLQEPSAEAVFTKINEYEAGLGAGMYYAAYPVEAITRWGSQNAMDNQPSARRCYVKVPTQQVAVNGSWDPKAGILASSSATSAFSFRHAVAYMRFSVSEASSEFTKLTLASNAEETLSAGEAAILYEQGNVVSISAISSPCDHVSISTSDGLPFSSGTYYLAFMPGVFSQGLTLSFENPLGDEVTKTINGTQIINAGDVADIGIVGVVEYDSESPSISVYKQNDLELGVTFYVDSDDPGKKKVLSAAGGVMQWATSNSLWGIHNYKQDYEFVHQTIISSDAYKANPDHFPAVKFCDQMRKNYGGNWHVPSVDEMNILFNVYYGKPYTTAVSKNLQYTDDRALDASTYFDRLLESIGGETLLARTNDYWICGQNSSSNMQYVSLNTYRNSNADQTTEKYVRCVLDVDETAENDIYPLTDVGKVLESEMTPKVLDVFWDTTYTVTPGLDYYQMKLLTDSYQKQHVYLLRADLSKGLEAKVAIAEQSTPTQWYKETLTTMAARIHTSSKPLYALVNGDFCDNNNPINPRGPVHCGGKVMWSVFDLDESLPQQGLSYVGVTNSGKMTIGPRDEYDSVKNSLKECTGAGVIMIQDSEIQGGCVNEGFRDPHTAIGYTSDNIVWILVVDGRHGTLGMTYGEMASIFKGLGCVAAVNLDGGGSTEMIVRDPLTNNVKICNWPSDPTDGAGGVERPRPTAWYIVKK